MVAQRIEFTNPSAIELLDGVREIARRDGREIEVVLEDAMRSYIAQNAERPNVRPEVMAHHRASVERNRLLYELLADS